MPNVTRRRFLAVAGATLATAAPRRVAAATRWVDQRQTGPFLVQATFDLAPHEGVLAELPELEGELRRVLALAPCRDPVTVELFSDRAEQDRALRLRLPDAPARRAMFVRQGGRSTVYAFRNPEMAVDLRHECTHALLHADLASAPLWLDEGLAEYFEVAALDRARGRDHLEGLKWNLRLGLVTTLPELERKHQLEDLTVSDYRFAWAWTHFLLHGPRPAAEALWSYLGALRRGDRPGRLSDRLEAVLPGTRERLLTHFRQWDRLMA